MYSLSVSKVHLETTFWAKSLWTHYLLRNSPLNSVSYSRNHYECTFFLGITLNALFCFANSLSVSRIYLKSTIIFAKTLRIRYEITMKPLWNQYEFTFFFTNLLSVLRFVYKNTIFFRIVLWIHCLFRKLSLNSLSISWFHYVLTI